MNSRVQESERTDGNTYPEMEGSGQAVAPCTCSSQDLHAAVAASRSYPSGEIHFSHTAIRLHSKQVVECIHSEDFVQLYFSMRGRSTFRAGDSSKPFAQFSANQHNLLFLSGTQALQEIKPDAQVEMMTVYVPTDFLLHYLPPTGAPFLQLRESILAGKPARLAKASLPITPKIMGVLHGLLSCDYTGYRRQMFVEAKTIELLLLQFEQSEQDDALPATSSLKQTEIEKMLHARELILQNIECPCSLIDLAHMVGTNEYYLKKHFKQVFGTTVFGYLNTYRMEQARKMLLEGDKKVGDIAGILGFKYAAHFTAAFKKHFGYLPQKIKS